MGKQELLDNFITGIFFKTVDIPVNRDNKISAYRAFKQAGEKLKSGINVVMFPEGGIADNYPPQVQEFKNGPFRLAITMQVPVIPVTSLNTWQMMWDDGLKYGTKPGMCKIFVHKPIATINMGIDDADKLRDKVQNIIKHRWGTVN